MTHNAFTTDGKANRFDAQLPLCFAANFRLGSLEFDIEVNGYPFNTSSWYKISRDCTPVAGFKTTTIWFGPTRIAFCQL
jgi:hypothetical protein